MTILKNLLTNRHYLSLIIFVDDNLDAVMEILTESQWDDSVDNLRPIRNKFCELVGVPAPAVLKKSAA